MMKEMIQNSTVWFGGILVFSFLLVMGTVILASIPEGYKNSQNREVLKAEAENREPTLLEKDNFVYAGEFLVDHIVYVPIIYIVICLGMHVVGSVFYTFRPKEPELGRYEYRFGPSVEEQYKNFVYSCTFAGPQVILTILAYFLYSLACGVLNFLPNTLNKVRERALIPPKLPPEKTAFSSPEEERLFKEFMAIKRGE